MTGKIGKYKVLGTLGKGAHSTIQQIRRETDNKLYALKVVPIDSKEDQKFLDQVKHEFRVAQMLDHPSLIKAHTLETESDWLRRVKKAFLLMELVIGKTIDEVENLSIGHLVQIFHRVADALVHCHRKGICHADLKPNNILLSRDGHVKIIDFGLSWIKGERRGRLQGTPEYMAPETAKTKLVNERSDIYNLGATMYRLVAQRKPPQVLNDGTGLPVDADTFAKLLKPVQACNPKVPVQLAELIDSCLSFDPAGRPGRASEVQGILDYIVEKMVKSPDRLESKEW